MNQPLIVEESDALLLPFLHAQEFAVADNLLTDLIQDHANPIIAKILKRKLHVSLNVSQGNQQNQDALEIAADVRALLIADLRAAQQEPAEKLIKSFPDYVAIKTYSACADYFREKNPQRWRLKNLLRYQLKQNSRFALWKAENNIWYAGLNDWAGTIGAGNSSCSANSIFESFSRKHGEEIEPAQLLAAIFEQLGHPIEFESVVTLAAEVWNVTDSPLESVDDADRKPESRSASSARGVDLLLEQRLYLERLWTEVGQLPVLQRAALLLNLRDAQGGSAIFFIPHLGVASQKQIAGTLGFPEQEFAVLWSDLPLDDTRLAELLELTRQQVINLRKTARERLARRMGKTSSKVGADTKKSRPFTA
jgi:hypothetical protein